MFIRPIFEVLGIALVAVSILLMVFNHTPLAFTFGAVALVAGLVIIYRHYVEMGTNPDVLEYVPGDEAFE